MCIRDRRLLDGPELLLVRHPQHLRDVLRRNRSDEARRQDDVVDAAVDRSARLVQSLEVDRDDCGTAAAEPRP
eukprot:6402376-Alexandrium_andersonii.AAC.1